MSTIVKISTKKGQSLYSRSLCNEGYTLHDVYGKPSDAKKKAYSWCFNKYKEDENAENFRMVGHNCHFFTVAWDSIWADPATGEVQTAVFMETSHNSYIILTDC